MSILLSFIAVNNDQDHGNGDYGPNVNLFRFEKFRSAITTAIFLYKKTVEQTKIIEYLEKSLKRELGDSFPVIALEWNGDDPTDHKILFREMKRLLDDIDTNIRKNEPLWIHITPGTPSMHAVWLLLAETGAINGCFKLFKSYRISENHPPKDIDIHADLHNSVMFYKKGSDDRVMWDPAGCISSQMKELFKKASMMAKLNVPILILGERGTGKTTLANWIRSISPYINSNLKEWPVIACGQYTDQLMSSELFGHKKGSFTGAYENKDGLLRHLDGDTLFLDEIGDVSKNMQRLLIRAIEEKRFIPLGSSETVHSDFRLISATNLNFHALQERLHPDFFDRISAFILEMPPLREIKEELEWLWPNVFFTCRQKARLPGLLNLTDEDHATILEFLKEPHSNLPGNIRDLSQLGYLVLGYLSANLDSTTAALSAIEDFQHYASYKHLKKPDIFDSICELQNGINRLERIKQHCKEYITIDAPIDSGYLLSQIKDTLANTAMEKSGNNKKKAAALLNLKDGKSIDSWIV